MGDSNQWEKNKSRIWLALVLGAASSPCRALSPTVPPVVKGCTELHHQQTFNPYKGKREHELAEIKGLGLIALLDKAPLL